MSPIDDLSGLSEDELAARRVRLTTAEKAAADRGDKATAARLQGMLSRVQDALVLILEAQHEGFDDPHADVDDVTGKCARTKPKGANAPTPTVHVMMTARRPACRTVKDLVPTTEVVVVDEPVNCQRCMAKMATIEREATVVLGGDAPAREPAAPKPPREPKAPRTGRRTGDPIPVALDVDLDPEPIPQADRDTAAATAGDLAALLLAAPIIAHLPLRAVGTITSASSVGIMASADGSLVVMAVD